ncbi:PilW family protein [Stutzerimonas stutzeri]|uniref:PilW family protein n=1 Tax=Stutzerimonas stutzeri TaxID=316 RepID=UPI0016454D2E|nr:PilW family protein [Stutzerimonas stutzeri]
MRGYSASAGFGLIELMVAMTLALVLSAATLTLYLNMSRSNSELAKTNSQMEHGRLAIRLLRDDLMHAGFLDGYLPEFDDLTATAAPADYPLAVPTPCAPYSAWDAPYKTNLLGVPVQLYATVPTDCASVMPSPRLGSDVLLVRHVASCVAGAANCETDTNGKLYWQTSYCESEPRYVFDTSGLALHKRNCTTSADKRRFLNTAYYIRDYAVSAGDGIPTLMQSSFDLTGGALIQQDALAMVEGIEAMRFVFGVDNLSDTGAAVDYSQPVQWASALNRNSPTNRGDGAPDTTCTSSTPCSLADLTNTVVVEIHLLVRNLEPTSGYQSNKTYVVGGETFGPFSDAFQRHVYSTTVRLTNVSARRETP